MARFGSGLGILGIAIVFAAWPMASVAADAATWPAAVATCAPSDAGNEFACPQANSGIVKLFADARAGDAAGVQADVLKPTDPDYAPYFEIARAFALQLADPARYTAAYVARFAKGGFTEYHFLDNLARVGLVPDGPAWDAVTRSAAAGDPNAYAALLNSAVEPLNEFHAPLDASFVASRPSRMFAMMKARGAKVAATYYCTQQDVGRDPGLPKRAVAVLRANAHTAAGRTLVNQLSEMLTHCMMYDVNG